MPWEFERDEAFEKAIKDLKKKFPNVEKDVLAEFESAPPQQTVPLPKFKRKLWKGRVASTDLHRGKSGGFRVIYYWDEDFPNWACLGTCYFKGDFENLPEHELNKLFVSVKSRYLSFIEREKQKQAQQAQPKQSPD